LIKAEFFIVQEDSPRPGYGQISFPAKSIPAVKASFEQGSASGGEPVAEPGAAPSFGPGNYSCRLNDPDGYLVEVCVAHN
jgi:predicted lactoylglutathione lyase